MTEAPRSRRVAVGGVICLLLVLRPPPCGARAGGGGRTGGGTTTSAPPQSSGTRPTSGGGYTVPRYIPPPPSNPPPPSYPPPTVRNESGLGPLIPAEKTPPGIRTGIGWVSWLILLVFLIPVLAIIYFVHAFLRSMSMARQAARDTFEQDPPAVTPLAPPRDPLEAIRAHDADFSEPVFLDRARTAFTAIQNSWEKRTLDEVRQYLTVETTSRFQIQIDEMKSKAERNVLDNLVFQGARVVAAGSEGGIDRITVRFEATMVDYILDEKTGRMVDGSMKPRPFVELWTFVRNIATSSGVNTASSTCAACGAPTGPPPPNPLPRGGRELPSSVGVACGYCGNAGAVANGIGWVLSTIDQVV